MEAKGDSPMGPAVQVRTDYSAAALRRLARISKDTQQSRRLLSLAAVLEGMNRNGAARIGGMDRRTLRDWMHRFNEAGGLCTEFGHKLSCFI
jgi:Helix-turn-helix domain